MDRNDAEPPGASGRRKPRATIYDVARLTGVSPSAVSRALNKPGRLNERTERRIREAAEAVGYRINPMARALPTGKTGTLGLMVSDITNPVYFELVRGAERAASRAGSILVFADAQESAELELATAERLQPAADGLVMVASRLEDDDLARLASVEPVVTVNRLAPGLPSIVPDLRPGIESALDRLAGLGHRRIAYLSGPEASWMNRARWEVLFALAVDRGMSIVEVGSAAPTRSGGAEAFERVRAAEVTAVLAYNDLIALGLLHECRGHGLDVPGRLSIVGFDDIFGADLPTPALSTIRSPLAAVGELAVERLLAAVNGDETGPGTALATEFVERESVAAAP